MSRRAVFLDRDGVLVETLVKDGRALAAVSLDEFQLCPDAGAEVRRLIEADLLPVVFTNQPEVARGALGLDTLARMHAVLRASVPVADILVCVHDEGDGCPCRKPRPGMLHEASRRWDIDLAASFVIGDRWRDVDAGRAVGCFSVLLERPYSAGASADARVESLGQAVDIVLERVREPSGLRGALRR